MPRREGDVTAPMPGPPASAFLHVVFRLQHNCPVANLSRELPALKIHSWSSRRKEVIHVPAPDPQRDSVAAAVSRHLPGGRVLPYSGGVMCVYEPSWPKGESITWALEDHDTLWLQPLRYEAGWEYYDVIGLEREGLAACLTDLSSRFPFEVVWRGTAGESSLLKAMFVSLGPIVDMLSAKQRQALQVAWKHGYYEAPRKARTRDLAERIDLSRSAFEERLRSAENMVIGGVIRAMTLLDESPD